MRLSYHFGTVNDLPGVVLPVTTPREIMYGTQLGEVVMSGIVRGISVVVYRALIRLVMP